MTGRERLEAILHRQPADRLSWTTLVDAATLDALPGSLGIHGELDFYRQIGFRSFCPQSTHIIVSEIYPFKSILKVAVQVHHKA